MHLTKANHSKMNFWLNRESIFNFILKFMIDDRKLGCHLSQGYSSGPFTILQDRSNLRNGVQAHSHWIRIFWVPKFSWFSPKQLDRNYYSVAFEQAIQMYPYDSWKDRKEPILEERLGRCIALVAVLYRSDDERNLDIRIQIYRLGGIFFKLDPTNFFKIIYRSRLKT